MRNLWQTAKQPGGFMDIMDIEAQDTLITPEYSLVRKSILFSMLETTRLHSEFFGIDRIRNADHPATRGEYIEALIRSYKLLRPKIIPDLRKATGERTLKLEPDEWAALISMENYLMGRESHLKSGILYNISFALDMVIEELGITKVQKVTNFDEALYNG